MSATDRLQRAQDELPRATRDASADDVTRALQHACQSLEGALKTIIAHDGQTVPTGSYGHDYRYLRSIAVADLSTHTDIIHRIIREVAEVVKFAESYLNS